MMKKYLIPEIRAKKVEACVMIPHSGHHDNGHHYGWDNPHNPHYQEEDEP